MKQNNQKNLGNSISIIYIIIQYMYSLLLNKYVLTTCIHFQYFFFKVKTMVLQVLWFAESSDVEELGI